MGRQSRRKQERKRQRRIQAFKNTSAPAPPGRGEPLRILRSLHKDMQNFCSESSRKCWEYQLEMMALSTGWMTDTAESQHLWEKFAPDSRWLEFFECWNAEVAHAKANATSFSEPFGELLEEIEATNEALGQFFTPMTVVRCMNAISLANGAAPPLPDGRPSHTGLDPTCGTGRFVLDALVHDDGIHMCGVELDLWLFRAAMVNARLLTKYSALRLKDRGVKAFKNSKEVDEGGLIVMGGRASFMHADSLWVDLHYQPNWRYPLYEWTPPRWQDDLKINGFDGTLSEYENRGRPERLKPEEPEPEIRFDYSMTDQPGPTR